MSLPESATRYLPPGFPPPDRETLARLRENILGELRTPHPPDWAELAVIVAADEAGVDLSALAPEVVWLSAPEERTAIFEALGGLLAELIGA